MTDPLVADEILEAVLRSRAGEAAPSDLHAAILAAVAADGPRAVTRRGRTTGHPWRLLAVAAVLLGTIGTALYVGTSRPSVVVAPTPGPSVRAVVPPRSPTPPEDSAAVTTDPTPAPTARACKPRKYAVIAGHGRPAPGEPPPAAFGTVAGLSWGAGSWTLDVGSSTSPFAQAAHGTGAGLGDVDGSSADHNLLLVSVSDAVPLGAEPWCLGLYVVRTDGSGVVVVRDGTTASPDGEAMSPSGVVAILEHGGQAGPTLSVTGTDGHVRVDDLHPCPAAFDATRLHQLTWSRDSSRLAVRCAPGVVMIVQPDDGSIVQVGDLDPSADVTAMTWTPDGRSLRLAVIADTELSIDTVDAVTNKVVSRTRADRRPDWQVSADNSFSPSGRWLLVGTGQQNPFDAFFVDPETGVTHEVTECGAANCMWASDSTITLPRDKPALVTVPDRQAVATWAGGGGFSFFTLLP